MDTQNHFVVSIEGAKRLVEKLVKAVEEVEAGHNCRHIHEIVTQSDAKGPWELILTVVD